MPKKIVEASGLTMHYQIDGASIKAIQGVDLDIASGEICAVIGPSGAGKSTLLHILGLLERPTTGSLLFDGIDTATLSEFERSRFRLQRVGFVFQFHHLLSEFTALENVMLPGLIQRKEWTVCSKQAEGLLERVGLEARLRHKPGELSGGEQQRVAFARALMNEPAIILADEPTGNLDRESSQNLRKVLWEICREKGAALVIVTHNEELIRGSDRKWRMLDGQLETCDKRS